MLRPVGRPKKGSDAKSVSVSIRMTPEDLRVLESLCREFDLSKSEVLVRGLEIQERMLSFDY